MDKAQSSLEADVQRALREAAEAQERMNADKLEAARREARLGEAQSLKSVPDVVQGKPANYARARFS